MKKNLILIAMLFCGGQMLPDTTKVVPVVRTIGIDRSRKNTVVHKRTALGQAQEIVNEVAAKYKKGHKLSVQELIVARSSLNALVAQTNDQKIKRKIIELGGELDKYRK